MNNPVTTYPRALGRLLDDRDCPTVYIEVCRDTVLKQDYGSVWVALNIRGKVGALCRMANALQTCSLDVAGVDCASRWGPTEDHGADVLEGTRLILEKVGQSCMLHLAAVQVCDGEDILFESIRLECGGFLVDVANGRRYFGNVLTDDDLEAEVDGEADAEEAGSP